MIDVEFKGELAFTLSSKQDWINRMPADLPKDYPAQYLVWIDSNGMCLRRGSDFIEAEYPVNVYKQIFLTQ